MMTRSIVLRTSLTTSLLFAATFSASAQDKPLGTASQFTHSINDSPTFSPDGRELVLITVVAGKEQLFRMGIDRSNPVQLTHDDADHEDPAWSPDGHKVAYVSIKGGQEQIFLMNADGSAAEPLTPSNQKTIHPNWAPDSRSVVYCTDDDLKPPAKNASDIYSIDLESRKITKVISGGTNTYPAWSPDGNKMAFRRMLGERNSEVFLVNKDGSGEKNLTDNPAFDGWPAWSPDGSKIAFASNRDGGKNYEIYIMNPDGSAVQKVASTEGRATDPQWSRDGKSIYFPICRKNDTGFDCQIYSAPVTPAQK
jgi:TolB protein